MKIKSYIFFIILSLSFGHSSCLLAQEKSYGICIMDVVPVRKSTADSTEQVTQLVFGDAFIIHQKDDKKGWIFIENSYDNYQGWIKNEQSFPISENYYQEYLLAEHPVSADAKGFIIKEEQKIQLAIASTLPFYKDGFIRIGNEKMKFEGKTKNIGKKSDKKTLIQSAYQYLNTPYLWGGKSNKGIDCSGFTQMVYKMNGYKIPRDAYQQAEKGKLIDFGEAKEGDLFFFAKDSEAKGRVVHVGIYLGKNKVLNASTKVIIDTFYEKGMYLQYSNGQKRYLKYVKRFE